MMKVCAAVEDYFSLGVLKYVVCLCKGCDGCCGLYLFCVSCSSCRCCMLVSCVHPVAVLNAAFCMTFRLLILVEDATIWQRHTPESVSLLPCR